MMYGYKLVGITDKFGFHKHAADNVERSDCMNKTI